MSLVVVTPPDPFIALDLAKQHLRVDTITEDELITAYIAAACAHIDGPDTWLGRAIGPQTLRADFCAFDDDLILLDGAPLTSISSVKYDDSDGVEQTISPPLYGLDPRGVRLAYGEAWPKPRNYAGSVRIEYVAGFTTIPPQIIAAGLLMVGDLYQNRETTVANVSTAVPMSATVQNLLAPFKVWRV